MRRAEGREVQTTEPGARAGVVAPVIDGSTLAVCTGGDVTSGVIGTPLFWFGVSGVGPPLDELVCVFVAAGARSMMRDGGVVSRAAC